MNPARFLRRSMDNSRQSAQSLSEIREGLANQSDLINRKLGEVIDLLRQQAMEVRPVGTPQIAQYANREVRPLERLANYPEMPGELTMKSIEAWHTSETFRKTFQYFEKYPNDSLLHATAGTFLYHLVRTLRPQTIIEIGTYYGASSEIMARALWENGMGTVHTTDPFGAARCPAIISQWPKPLQQHVKFYPLNSMAFFSQLEEKNMKIDIAFIDGNHDYEYVYFDLLSAARMIKPGGIIVLDDTVQTGPFWAGVEFLRTHPEWRELGDSISGFNAAKPFEYPKFLRQASCAVLQAPEHYVITSAPNTMGQIPYAHGRVEGIKLDIANPGSSGTLHAQIILRGFFHDEPPEQLITTQAIPVQKQTAIQALLDKPLVSKRDSSATRYTIEIILFWQPESGNEPLRLNAVPQAFTAESNQG